MNSPPTFSDSPRGSALLRPTDSPRLVPHAPRSTDSPEVGGTEKLPAISSTSHLSVRNESSAMSSSAPSLRSALRTRPFHSSSDVQDAKPETTEGSSGQNGSNHRVSFEGSYIPESTPSHSPGAKVNVHPLLRGSGSQTPKGIESAMLRIKHSSDPADSPPTARSPGGTNSPKKPGRESPLHHTSRSRTTSPLRHFTLPGFHRPHEDPFVPVDPFQLRTRLHRLSLHSRDVENNVAFDPGCEENPFCCFTPVTCNPDHRFLTFLHDARYFILDTLPRQLYLAFLLFMPALYFSRIARLYEDAQLSKPDLDCMIQSYSNSYQLQLRRRIATSSPIPPGAHMHVEPVLPFPDEWTTTNVSPALVRFKQSWEAFIDSLLREWKTLNLVSALLHSAILAMFQSTTMANDPVIRTSALLSLTSALMSLSYGCIYIVRFGTMRTMDKATRWAEESARTTTFIVWNVWVMLAMPAVWLAWSMIYFIIAILAFVWRYGSSTDPASPALLSPSAALGSRIVISALFFLGLVYLLAIVQTLHNYGRTAENRLLGRMTPRNETSNAVEDDAQRRGRASQRGSRTSSRHDVNDSRQSRENHGDEQTRPRQDGMELGALSAVTGLGLTDIGELANPSRLDAILVEKQ